MFVLYVQQWAFAVYCACTMGVFSKHWGDISMWDLCRLASITRINLITGDYSCSGAVYW